MYALGIFYTIFGLCYLIYSIILKNSITWYFKVRNIIVLDQRFFKLQLIGAIINSPIFVALGLSMVIYKINNPFIYFVIVVFGFVNWLIYSISLKREYIRKTNN